jgi:hypothetical protein
MATTTPITSSDAQHAGTRANDGSDLPAPEEDGGWLYVDGSAHWYPRPPRVPAAPQR